jgi:hypothetical protein
MIAKPLVYVCQINHRPPPRTAMATIRFYLELFLPGKWTYNQHVRYELLTDVGYSDCAFVTYNTV